MASDEDTRTFGDLMIGDEIWDTTVTDAYPLAHPTDRSSSLPTMLWIELADGRTGAVMANDPVEDD